MTPWQPHERLVYSYPVSNPMPYQAHFAFVAPQEPKARLWRYMDLPRFLSILDRRGLFFPSAATLSEADPYEGEPVAAKIQAARERGQDEVRRLRIQAQLFKHLNFFNCWHMNDGESDAMWKIYMRGAEGIAIQSTVRRLQDCFRNYAGVVYMGEVQYGDHANITAQTVPNFGSSDYMLKRLAFQHEREVRAGTYSSDVRAEFFDKVGILKAPPPGVRAEDILLSPGRRGVYVDADIRTLVERVVVSPLSPNWFSDLVVSLSRGLGYDFEIVPSEMSRPPPLSFS